MKYDILAIGDIVIDNFIRLKEAEVNCDENKGHCKLSMSYGTKIPFEFSVEVPAVGNAANAAVCCARLGITSAFASHIGNDANGEKCIQSLNKDHVVTELVEKQAGKITNYHYVLWFESDRTILIKHEEFNYHAPSLPEPPRWIYLSSLSKHSLQHHTELASLFAKLPNTKIAFQPGTFQIEFGTKALADIYARTEIFFCNKEEAQQILNSQEEDPKKLLQGIRALGPRIAVITNDRHGAYAMDKNNSWMVPMYPDPRPPYERTGAGDAFSSTVVAALALGEPLEKALLWGPINAMSVVQSVGAQEGLLSRERIQKLLDEAPADYKISPLK